jgi:hypothetical protein
MIVLPYDYLLIAWFSLAGLSTMYRRITDASISKILTPFSLLHKQRLENE